MTRAFLGKSNPAGGELEVGNPNLWGVGTSFAPLICPRIVDIVGGIPQMDTEQLVDETDDGKQGVYGEQSGLTCGCKEGILQ